MSSPLIKGSSCIGSWIGIFDDIEPFLEDSKLNINVGDIILLYTDGITEAWEKGSIKEKRTVEYSMYGDGNLIKVFQKNSQTQDLEGIKQSILKSLEDYEYDDDITMVLVKRVE